MIFGKVLPLLLAALVQTAFGDLAGLVDKTLCGQNYGCFLHPPGCDPALNNCVAVARYSTDTADPNYIVFVLGGRQAGSIGAPNAGGEYVALGFSSDQQMGEDAVTSCTSAGNVLLGYNAGKSHKSVDNVPQGFIQQLDQGVNNGAFWCHFKQMKTPPAGSTEVFDLNQDHTLFLAVGNTDAAGSITQHDTVRGSGTFPAISSAPGNVARGTSFNLQGETHIPPAVVGGPGAGPVVIHQPPGPGTLHTPSPFQPGLTHNPQPEPIIPGGVAGGPVVIPEPEPIIPNLSCQQGSIFNTQLQGALQCSGQWCYVRADSAIPRTDPNENRATMGCDEGVLCQQEGCQTQVPATGVGLEKVCCCKSRDQCSDEYIGRIFEGEITVGSEGVHQPYPEGEPGHEGVTHYPPYNNGPITSTSLLAAVLGCAFALLMA